MAYTTFSKNKNDQLKEPMFFGQNVNVARYDQQKYSIFERLIEKQLSFFWRPEEVDVSQDRIDYAGLPDHEKHIFISNLKYQTLLDSVQGRSPNVAFLPIVSIPELETWVETWSFSECVAENTEVLTPKGWVDISTLTTNDEVLVYDFENETVFFEKPKRTTNYQVDNRLMVELVAKNPKQFHQFVTPNHRMPVKNRVKPIHTPTKQFVEAGLWEYRPHHLAPVSGHSTQKGDELTYIERILIAAQADGSWKPDRYTGARAGTIPILFEFSKQHKIERLNLLAQMANVEIVELTPEKAKGNIKLKRRFKINFPVEFVPQDIKLFDSWVDLKSMSSKKAEEFLDEVSYWDSHIYISKTGNKTFTYTSTVKSNIDIIQAIAVMAGKQARYSFRSDNRKETYSDVHAVNVVNSLFKDGQSIKKNLVPYTGKVYCIETSTGAFIIRYNNTVSVTGNTIHSRSYTHIIRNIVNDPSIIFDDIVENPEIQKRAKPIAKYYDDLILESQLYQLHGDDVWYRQNEDGSVVVANSRDELMTGDWKNVTLFELKRKLYLCIQSINALEAIRFYVSFSCSFAFAERGLMEGNAKIIKLIARDEALHLTGTQHILNLMASGIDDPDFAQIAEDCKEESIQLFQEVVEQEKEWAKYLFKDGSMVGLNEEILIQYVEYIANIRMNAIGLGTPYPIKNNPIPWINAWLTSDNVQVAPQEVEISSYLVGQIDAQVDTTEFGGFEL